MTDKNIYHNLRVTFLFNLSLVISYFFFIKTITHNKAIAFIGLGRANNSINEIKTLLSSETNNKKIFPMTVQYFNENNLNEIQKEIKNNGCLSEMNLIEYLGKEYDSPILIKNVNSTLPKKPGNF